MSTMAGTDSLLEHNPRRLNGGTPLPRHALQPDWIAEINCKKSAQDSRGATEDPNP
jgi:hypothetical protein